MIARTDTKTTTAATHHCQSPRRPLPGGITRLASSQRAEGRTEEPQARLPAAGDCGVVLLDRAGEPLVGPWAQGVNQAVTSEDEPPEELLGAHDGQAAQGDKQKHPVAATPVYVVTQGSTPSLIQEVPAPRGFQRILASVGKGRVKGRRPELPRGLTRHPGAFFRSELASTVVPPGSHTDGPFSAGHPALPSVGASGGSVAGFGSRRIRADRIGRRLR
jgi:hypothetical protein